MTERVIVSGGGPVGLAVALGLAHHARLDVTVLERDVPVAWEPPDGFDPRVYALSPASLDWLAGLGVKIDAPRVAPVHAMQIWGDHSESPLVLQQAVPLAAIVEHGALMHSLHLASNRRIVLDAGAEVRGFCDGALQLANGQIREVPLVVAAEGRRSVVRDAAGIAVDSVDYASTGVVANFACVTPHRDIARQWFLGNSILALLPLPGRHVSMVWSLPHEAARSLLQRSPEDVAREVCEAANLASGELRAITHPIGFPLVRQTARQWVMPGLALAGDAAHTVHPLAGQGVNLGFGDAAELSRQLAGRSRFSSVGDLAVLRRYERARREPALRMATLTHGLRDLYLAPGEAEGWLRNRGLGLLNRLPLIKDRLIQMAIS